MNVTDEMVAAARQAYWDECEVTTGKVGMRLALEAAIAFMRGQSDMVMVPRDVVDSIEHCVSKDLRPYFETIVLWAEKIKASTEGPSR